MAKVQHSVATRRRKKRVLKRAKGYWLDRSKQFQQARRALLHADAYAYRDRRVKKRTMRRLWIVRINAACRQAGLTYSRFLNGLKKAKVAVNRKMLAELAVKDLPAIHRLVEIAKKG
jgi:large subunit ribosomal protein L20